MNLSAPYKIDISHELHPTPLQQMLISADKNANRLAFEIYDGEAPFSPGGSCVGYVVRADGETVPMTGTVSGNLLSIVLPEEAYSVEGPVNVVVKSVAGGSRSTIFYGYGTILSGATGTIVNPGDVIPDITELMAAIDQMEQATAAANAAASKSVRYDIDQSATLTAAQKAQARINIQAAHYTDTAPLFSTSSDYAAGDVVIYDGNLRRFTTAHPAGAWIGTDTTADTISGLIGENAEEIGKALLYKGMTNASDYSNLLRNIAEPGMFYISLQGASGSAGYYTDRPVDSDGSAAVLLSYPVSTAYVLQNLIDVHGGNFFRYIKVSDQSVYAPSALNADANGWFIPGQLKTALASIADIQQDMGTLQDSIDENAAEIEKALLYKGTARSADYSQLLSNIDAQGMYYISRQGVDSGAGIFNDRPVDSDGSAAILLAYPVSTTHVLQNLIDVHGGNFFRYIDVSDQSVYAPSALNADANGWYLPKQFNAMSAAIDAVVSDLDTLQGEVDANTENLQKAFLYMGMVKSADYSGSLKNINAQGVYYLSQQSVAAGEFDDRPVKADGSAAALLVYPMSASFVLQHLIDVHGSSFFRYIRVSNNTVYAPTQLRADANGWYIPRGRERWVGKKVVFFGDSRTWYDGQTYANDDAIKTDWRGETCVGYQQQCADLLGIIVENEGVSGNTSAQICARIRAYDFTGIDAVFLEGGVNDYIRRVAENVQIGEIAPIGGDTETYPDTGFDTGTVYGAWQSAIEYICKNYPQVKIFMDIPAIAWNANGVFPYSTASIKGEIAELYNIPCLNLYKEAGINELNRDYYYVDNPDYGTRQWRLHFNNYGNAHVGQIIAEFINTH